MIAEIIDKWLEQTTATPSHADVRALATGLFGGAVSDAQADYRCDKANDILSERGFDLRFEVASSRPADMVGAKLRTLRALRALQRRNGVPNACSEWCPGCQRVYVGWRAGIWSEGRVCAPCASAMHALMDSEGA